MGFEFLMSNCFGGFGPYGTYKPPSNADFLEGPWFFCGEKCTVFPLPHGNINRNSQGFCGERLSVYYSILLLSQG